MGWVKNIEVPNVTDEENRAIDYIKQETGNVSTSKAVRQALISYQRLSETYKDKCTECIELRKELKRMRKILKSAHENMAMATQMLSNTIGHEQYININ